MPSVIYVASDESQVRLDLPLGTSVMYGAILNGISGIVAECGGSAMCATCHVYVRERFLPLLPEIGEVEDEMLDAATSERRPTSRLSCQIIITDELDGLTVDLPERQV